MNTHEFIRYKLEFHLNNPYIPIEEEILSIFNKRDNTIDNAPIEKAHNVKIGDVLVNRVEFKDVESTLVTLKQFLEQMPTNEYLSFKTFKHFKKKWDLGMQNNFIKLL